jgi:hypothetical protein
MNVVLISRDHRLGAILTMALSAPEQLTVLDSPAEVPESLEVEIDAVVLDLPADDRRDAYDELRQRYEGRVVVPVDNAKDTSGWPPDAKRRFLVRPFHVADLIAGVQEPQETSVAERAAKYRRRFRLTRNQAPAFPLLTAAPSAADEPSPAPPAATTPEEPADTAPEELAYTDASEPSADADGDATVEFVMEEEVAEDAAGEDQAEAAFEVAAEDEAATGEDAEAATGEERAEAGIEEVAEATAVEDAEPTGEELQAETGIEEHAEATATEDDAEQEVAEAIDEEDRAEAIAEEDAEAHAEAQATAEEDSGEDEALIASLEGLVLAEDGEGEEAGWADLEPQPRSVKDLRLLLSPERPDQVVVRKPQPALPVQAGIAMAEAVALKQRLESEEIRRSHGRRLRVFANVAAGLVLLLAGIGIGRAIAPERPQKAGPPAVQQPVVQFRNAPPPTACTAAMDNADQVISYLVAKIRDERLSKSIQAYGANARACRTTGR